MVNLYVNGYTKTRNQRETLRKNAKKQPTENQENS